MGIGGAAARDQSDAQTSPNQQVVSSVGPVTLTVYLVRHGATSWNAEGRLQGQTDVPLSPDGRDQARRLARRFARAWAPGAPASRISTSPDFVFTSDLSRAIETAAICLESLPLHASQVHATPRLRERGFGPWESFTIAEARRHFGEERNYRTEGEPPEEVWNRMGAALSDIWSVATASTTRNGIALVVGHGGSLRQLVCQAIGFEPSTAASFYLDNTGLSVIEVTGKSLEQSSGMVRLWNDTAHLFFSEDAC